MPKCRLHNVDLLFGKTVIRRGLPPAPPDGFFDAEGSLFPNARTFEIGGCVMPEPGGPNDRDEKRVRYCPSCRQAQKAWQLEREVDDFWKV